jgi:hypothetical protein
MSREALEKAILDVKVRLLVGGLLCLIIAQPSSISIKTIVLAVAFSPLYTFSLIDIRAAHAWLPRQRPERDH